MYGYKVPLIYSQILCMYDALDRLPIDKTVTYIQQLQQPDGSFYGDKWGEVDTRFSFCAVAALALLVGHRATYHSILLDF